MPPPPGAGYVPTFHMPIVGPPPTGTTPASHYSAVTTATTLQVVPGSHLSLEISLSNASFSEIFAMVGGLITFIPAGAPLPTADAMPSPGSGSLVIQTWVVDVQTLRRSLPPGVPPPTSVLYLNVAPATVRTALQPMVHALAVPVLQGAWNQASSTSDRTTLENNYLDRLLLGQTSVFVPGGTPVGNAERVTPGNVSSDTRMTLRFTDGAGNDLSPLLHLRSMPSFGARWVGHPLVTATATTPVPVNIYLQFEVWNETSHLYVPLLAGVAVDLMDYDDVSPNDLLATQNTDAQGRVHFSIPNIQILDEPEPDLFFLVHTNGRSHAGHTLPSEWSTKGWKATDGSAGYYENFQGTQLGDTVTPLIFRIGVDLHARIEYRHTPSASNRIAPKGIPVSVWVGTPPGMLKRQFQTNSNGELHGVIFDVDAEDSIYYFVEFEVTDASINLPRAHVQMTSIGWRTFWNDSNRKYYPDNDRTTLGSFARPDVFSCTVDDRNVALYFLKILRELSTFLFRMTGGAWTGVNNLTMFRNSISNHPYSWPVGEVNIPPSFHWDRGTLVHELSHQVMWKEVGFSSAKIALEFGPGGELHGYHSTNSLFNEEHALIEGWAEFLQAIFEGSGTPPYSLGSIVDDDGVAVSGGLGPPPLNRGQEIEGAFANGLWAIFEVRVVTPAVSSSASIPESINGDVTATASWLTNTAVRNRFLSMIWNPLKDLEPLSDPETSDMHAAIRLHNPTSWHMLQADLQAFNEAMEVPTASASSMSPATGPAAGGQHITITGTNFVLGTSVTIGGAAATNVAVNSSTTLTADTPPGAVGHATLIVTTPAGSATVPGAYQYV